MSEGLIDLLFWIVVFAAILFGFRWMQKRNRDKQDKD